MRIRWKLVIQALVIIPGLIFGGVATAYLLGGVLAAPTANKPGFLQWLPEWPLAPSIVNVVINLLVFVMVIATALTLAERKWSALMQNRIGPNRARLPFLENSPLVGIPHVITDVLKMLTKEDFVPKDANPILFNLGPMLAFGPVFALFAIVPVGPTVPVFGQTIELVAANPDFGLLYLFGIA
jgi:NADH-quinone oxidoreductase subunit H